MAAVRVGSFLLAVALVSGTGANAQETSSNVVPPLPGQILTANRIFISNAGSDSYGSETYFRLTRYDGGPDRFYNQFYAAMNKWGRYELTDSPSTSDVVYELRFSSPIVDKQTRHEFVYDPQLGLTIVDPKTRVALWSLTEHIQPGNNRLSDNTNFDAAVDRIVMKAKSLVTSPMVGTPRLTLAEMAPVGAIEVAHRESQAHHAAIGSAVGMLSGVLLASRNFHPCPLGSSGGCEGGRALSTLGYLIGGAVSGAVVGWFWPSH